MSPRQALDQNEKQRYIDVPINDKLKDLGAKKFVRLEDLVQIVLSKNRFINFNVHPKQIQRHLNVFEKYRYNDT
jgi:hypothetical protein